MITPIEVDQKPRARLRPMPDPQAHAFTIEDAQRMGAPGRTTIYALAKAGRLKLVRLGRRTLVNGDSLRTLLNAA